MEENLEPTKADELSPGQGSSLNVEKQLSKCKKGNVFV